MIRFPKIVGVILALILLSFVLYYFSPTAFFVLPQENQETQQTTSFVEQQTGEVDVGLSFKVLEKTKISVDWSKKTIVPTCPETTDIVISVKNSGNAAARKVSVAIPPTFRVVACEKCDIAILQPQSTVQTKAKLCRQTGTESLIEITAVNANPVSLQLQD